jgi:hypothetical protein
VKDFEQGDADETLATMLLQCHQNDARDEKHELHRAWSLSAHPRPDVILRNNPAKAIATASNPCCAVWRRRRMKGPPAE